MARESAADKGRRLLTEGRLRVIRVERANTDPALSLVVAKCRGDSGEEYDLGFDPGRRQWRCTCQEMKGRCSHLAALQLVTVRSYAA